MKTKEKIEEALKVLMGEELVFTEGHGELTEFYFAINDIVMNNGELGVDFKYCLKVQCGWRITEGSRVVVGNRDILKPFEEDGNMYDHIRNSRADAVLNELVGMERELTVLKVEGDDFGGVRLFLSCGVVLELYPDQSIVEEGQEYHWKLHDLTKEKELLEVN